MSRLIYICDWLPPDFGAVGQYSLKFARQYAQEQGHDVVLVGLTGERAVRAVQQFARGSLTVVKIQARRFDRQRWRRRLVWTVVTNAKILLAVWPDLLRCERIIITGTPPFMLFFVAPWKLLLRKRLIYRITDFYPECLMAALGRTPGWLKAFYGLTCALRRRVDEFEALGHDQKRRLMAIGIPPERIVLKRDPSPVTITGCELALVPPKVLDGHVTLLYSGNWGVAHDAKTFVEGYIEHHRAGSGRVRLWLNATGTNADDVEQKLHEAGVPFARTEPVPLELLPRLLITPDAHLITLRDAFVGYVMPSKVYGCIASNRPILFVGSAASDVDLLCSRSGLFYRRIDVGDPQGVVAALEGLADLRPTTPEQRVLRLGRGRVAARAAAPLSS